MSDEIPTQALQDGFDYIVVGGGTAGLIVAARLTENADARVLVLEAGENQLNNHMINIPAMWPAILGSDVDWAFLTEPQTDLKGRILRQPQGKALGGSSAINAQIFVAPSKAEIDAWGQLGNSGWDWESLAPYYRKFHTLHLPPQANREHLGIDWNDETLSGVAGPIQASFPVGPENPFPKAWVDTFKSLGLSIKVDPFSGRANGGYSNASTIDPATKTRSYTAPAYYAPASTRPNLTVITGATVKRVLLEKQGEGDDVLATGVAFSVNGKDLEARATHEVIVAAGVFQSPKVLELSGIGNSDLLKALDILVYVDNPNVGENLQDHAITGFSVEVADDIPTADCLLRQEPEAVQQAMGQYTTNQTGPLTYGSIASHALMSVTDALTGSGRMEELAELFEDYAVKYGTDPTFDFVQPVTLSPEQASACILMFSAQINTHDDKGEPGGRNYLQLPKPGNYATFASLLSHPLSRGSTQISSADVNVPPKIDPKYLSHPLDLEVLSRHLLSLETLIKQDPLAQHLKLEGSRNHETAYFNNSLDLAKDYARTTVISNNHPSCSCSMKPRESGGVVDARLRVYGTQNLRVVDSSVMPIIPRGNIQSTVYAVAERAADIIKEDRTQKVR